VLTTTPVLSVVLALQLAWQDLVRRARRDQGGQASAEYALVLLGAAAVALLVVSWATKTDKVGKLLDGVLDKLLGHAN
jgi:Flp pilus assembly pilin Flp